MLKGDSKIHIAGISSIIVVVLSSFWLFGLADNVFNFNSPVQENKEGFWNLIIKQNEKETLVEAIEDEREQNKKKVLEQDISNNEPSQSTKEIKESAIVSTESQSEAEDDEYGPQIKKTKAELLQERIELLEKKSFELSGSGTGWEGSPHLSKYTIIELELEPIVATELAEFRIKSGKLVIDGAKIDLEGKARIKDDNFIIEIEQNDAMDPYLIMTAKFGDSIVDDKDRKIQLVFEDQLLYLIKDETTPIHLDLETILSY